MICDEVLAASDATSGAVTWMVSTCVSGATHACRFVSADVAQEKPFMIGQRRRTKRTGGATPKAIRSPWRADLRQRSSKDGSVAASRALGKM